MNKEIQEMCDLIDEFAKCHISTDTEMFELQQGLIRIARRYREKVMTCNDSGIQFNRSGKVEGFL